MKKNLFLFLFIFLFQLFKAQHSPYFYQKPYAPNEITSDEHAKYIKRVCFKPGDNGEDKSNVLKQNENGEFVEFKPLGLIEQHFYFEHSLKYYYDKYLKDASKKKEDWDYTKIVKEQETAKGYLVHGWMVVIYKINGTEIASQIYMRDPYQFVSTTFEANSIWYRPFAPKDESKNIYADFAKENSYPILFYLRDQAKPGKYKIEVEVYPGKIECKKSSERSDEIICKGELTLVVSPDEAKEISGCGGSKKIPTDIRFYTIAQGTFEYK